MKKQAKITLFVIISIIVLGFAILIWANATGRVTIGANMIPPPGPTPTSTIQGYPVCKSVTVSNAPAGWYDSVMNKLIQKDDYCGGYTAKCLGSTNMSRGWYKVKVVNGVEHIVLIGYANCTLSPTTSPVPSPTPVVKSCVDSDGGIVPDVFGTVTTKRGSLTDTQSDRCVDNGTLEEAYCESPNSSAVGFRKIYGNCQGGKIVSISPTSAPTPNCVDECVSGNLVCTSATSYQICGNFDSDPCLEYKNHTCPMDKICQNNTIITKPTHTPSPTIAPTTTPTANPSPTSTIQTPSIPINLRATGITNSSANLTWDAVATAIRYGVYNAKTVSWVDTVNTNSYKLNGLKCETDYSFHVTAINDQGYGSNPSDTVNIKTSQCEDIVTDINTKKPENAKITYDGINIKISWDSVGDANGYDIYSCSGDYIVSTDKTSHTFTSSNCGNNYCYYIIAHDRAGNQSKMSDQLEITTDPCNATPADDYSQDISTVAITSLVSTGASLWFNILIALLLILGIGYFMFRKDIHNI